MKGLEPVMKQAYKIIYQGGEHEITEKKSRFIAAVRPVSSEEEALAFIAERRKRYWDASHHCFAFLIGENHELTRCSDDGEPARTAGRPMLDVLSGSEIHNVCAVVTRYFGGTLLGTGGLVRAYSSAVRDCLKNCKVMEKCPGIKLEIAADYTDLGKIQYIIGEMGIAALNTEYSDTVSLTLLVPADEADQLKAKLSESTGGRCSVKEPSEQLDFVKDGREVVLLM